MPPASPRRRRGFDLGGDDDVMSGIDALAWRVVPLGAGADQCGDLGLVVALGVVALAPTSMSPIGEGLDLVVALGAAVSVQYVKSYAARQYRGRSFGR
jgi:hypothetical protein